MTRHPFSLAVPDGPASDSARPAPPLKGVSLAAWGRAFVLDAPASAFELKRPARLFGGSRSTGDGSCGADEVSGLGCVVDEGGFEDEEGSAREDEVVACATVGSMASLIVVWVQASSVGSIVRSHGGVPLT